MIFPLHKYIGPIPSSGPNAFGAARRYDIHTGVDLFAPFGSVVRAIESGVVVSTGPFTGILADSPWWNDTSYVLIAGNSGVFLYGEILSHLSVGDEVEEGWMVGLVQQVLKTDKGRPMSMLHLELYQHGYVGNGVIWKDGPKPDILLNPTDILLEMYSE